VAFAPDETTELTPIQDEISQPLPIPGDPDEWFVGAVIDDRYELQRKLGHGAMGDVYLARDRLLKKHVAVKALRATLAQQIEVLRRFRREVALAHSVTHPAVVRIYDTGEAHGLPYFTMEYLRGQTLDDLLGELAEGAPPMSIREIRETAHEILEGMQAAHEAGVIHRDLKPANVMLTRRGAIVMDFGVAGFGNVPQLSPDASELGDTLVRTEAGTIFGSPAYMAPELWDGENASVQTDLYAFGVLLYQMLTGELPFSAPNATAFLAKLRDGKYPPVRSLRRDTPLALATLVSRCMSRDVDQRPRSANEAARMVAPLNRRRRIAAGVTVVAAIGAGTAFWLSESDEWTPVGLPDAVALRDMSAAIRSFDVGAHQEALQILDRLELRAPRSAAVAFWRATIHHDAGSDTTRRDTCPRGDLRGTEAWAALASAACGKTYELSAAALESLDGRGAFAPQLLPLAVTYTLVPGLEGSRDPTAGSLSRAQAVLGRLASEPHWNDDTVVMPIRWQLARARLMIALDDVPGAAGVVDELTESRRGRPAAMAYGSWLSAQMGRRSRAEVLASQTVSIDPRPQLRLLLDDGRLATAGEMIDRAKDDGWVLHAAMLETWCGYAFRYELGRMPERCESLPPGLVRAMWAGGSTERDSMSMSSAERGVINSQIELNRGICLDHAPTVSALQHLSPPFSTYVRQLEISAALCPGGDADLTLAKRLSESLLEHDAHDPWARLLDAQVDEFADDEAGAERQRRQVALSWGAADVGLPLVERLRQLVGVVAPSKPIEAAPPALETPMDESEPGPAATEEPRPDRGPVDDAPSVAQTAEVVMPPTGVEVGPVPPPPESARPDTTSDASDDDPSLSPSNPPGTGGPEPQQAPSQTPTPTP
jgi:tRNA A-37 threonylcarbamoyl transferase component Bud32